MPISVQPMPTALKATLNVETTSVSPTDGCVTLSMTAPTTPMRRRDAVSLRYILTLSHVSVYPRGVSRTVCFYQLLGTARRQSSAAGEMAAVFTSNRNVTEPSTAQMLAMNSVVMVTPYMSTERRRLVGLCNPSLSLTTRLWLQT